MMPTWCSSTPTLALRHIAFRHAHVDVHTCGHITREVSTHHTHYNSPFDVATFSTSPLICIRTCILLCMPHIHIQFQGHSLAVKCLCWVRSYRSIASSGLDRDVLLWDPKNGHRTGRLRGHKSPVIPIYYHCQLAIALKSTIRWRGNDDRFTNLTPCDLD